MPQYMSINPSPTQQQSVSLIGDALVQVRSLADLSHVLAADVPMGLHFRARIGPSSQYPCSRAKSDFTLQLLPSLIEIEDIPVSFCDNISLIK
jgi:hypothetical protein